MNTKTWILPACASLLAAPATAQASFTEIAEGVALDVSSDGAHVAGRSSSGGGYVWSASTGVSTNIGEDDAVGVSDDGTQAYGNVDDPGTTLGAAGTYDVAAGLWTSLGGIPGDIGCSGTLTSAYGWSNDGGVGTGLGWDGCKGRAFRWTSAGGVVQLPQAGTGSTRGNTVSGDGTHIGGWDRFFGSSNKAAIWQPDGSVDLILLGTPGNADGLGEVIGLSTDGSRAAGKNLNQAIIWSDADGVTTLPKFLAQNVSEMRAISDDGKTAVGWEGGSGPFGNPPDATIWREGSGIQKLADVLTENGLTLPLYPLSRAMDLSADGLTIVGTGTTGFFEDIGWQVTLPPSPWENLDGGTSGVNGKPRLIGQGSLAPGSAGSLSLTNAAPNAPALLGISALGVGVPIFGGILHTNPADAILSLSTNAQGRLNVPFNWPPAMTSGVSLTFQVGTIDLANPFFVSLSNGLRGTTP